MRARNWSSRTLSFPTNSSAPHTGTGASKLSCGCVSTSWPPSLSARFQSEWSSGQSLLALCSELTAFGHELVQPTRESIPMLPEVPSRGVPNTVTENDALFSQLDTQSHLLFRHLFRALTASKLAYRKFVGSTPKRRNHETTDDVHPTRKRRNRLLSTN